jgi:hypothetical protein
MRFTDTYNLGKHYLPHLFTTSTYDERLKNEKVRHTKTMQGSLMSTKQHQGNDMAPSCRKQNQWTFQIFSSS